MGSIAHRISRLSSWADVDRLVHAVNAMKGRGAINIHIGADRIFPNAAVPVAAALGFYRRSNYGVRVSFKSPEASDARIDQPLRPTKKLMQGPVLGKVWEYHNEAEAMVLCGGFVEALSEHAVCSDGVIESLNWCLYEIMDNVFQHSEVDYGYAMMQVHPKNRWLAVAISDAGIGIHRSFVNGGVHRTNDAYEAIKLAIQERVTSKTKNMGNGLYGLVRVVGINRGQLVIRSGRGRLEYKAGILTGEASTSRPVLETNDHHGTSVDWQLDLSHPVHMSDALPGSRNGNLRMEKLENDWGQHFVRVIDFEEGLGSRRSAEAVRNKLVNLLSEGAAPLILDFDEVKIVSSSFADEVLGKLALEMGIVPFMTHFSLRNMSPTVEAIVSRAVQQRLEEGDSQTPGGGPSWRPTTG